MRQPVLVHSRHMDTPGASLMDRGCSPRVRRRRDRPDSSVRSGHGEHLGPLALREATPDAVGLVNLQGVRTTGGHRGALETHGLGLGFAARARRSTFALGVEEERAGHASAGGVQLPIPEISIRAGKAPGVRHVDPHFDHPKVRTATPPGIWARATSRKNSSNGSPSARATGNFVVALPRIDRIRADLGVVDLSTLDRFSALDKTLITIFFDLDRAARRACWRGPNVELRAHTCGIAHIAFDDGSITGEWRGGALRLLSAVKTGTNGEECPMYPLCGSCGPLGCYSAEGMTARFRDDTASKLCTGGIR